MLSNEILVNISPEKKYPIFVDIEPLENLEEKIFKYTNANKILLVVSAKVDKLYGKQLNFKNCYKVVLPDGENQKSFMNYEWLCNCASKLKLERKDAIVAVGGGVVGDIAGFAAATYLRGIDFIQIPTTLLACVDSSVGGKVAINTDFGKNLVGAFYQPKAVFCNINFLTTLDERQLKTGLAEIVKYAFIEKSCEHSQYYELFDFLSANFHKILSKNLSVLSELVKICLNLKASVVTKDEKEQGLRKILNFGHTLGHAIERLTNYKKYTHGEAIIIGMKFAITLAFQKNLILEDYKIKALELINNYSIVKKIPKFNTKKLMELMYLDKKVEDGNITFILPSAKSKVTILNNITEEEILQAINAMS